MKILELFAGTGSVGKIAKELGHVTTSLDLKGANININILDWDYTAFPRDSFDYIHASPPCECFSHCRKSNYGKALKAHNPDWSIPHKDKIKFSKELFLQDQLNIGLPILEKTLDIIAYFMPKFFTLENPQTGDMKKYISDDIDYTDCTYCKYGFPYKKKTRIWNNFNLTLKECKKDCPFMVKTGGSDYHLQNCGNGKQITATKHLQGIQSIKGGGQNRDERYRIPPLLIKEWFKQMNTN